MNRILLLKILLGLFVLMALLKLLTTIFAEPWVGKKIQAELNEKNKDFTIEISKVHLSIITRGIELEGITIRSKQEHGDGADFNGKIASVKFKGLQLGKAIFKNDIDIRVVSIYNSVLTGKLPLSKEKISPNISPLNIRLGKVIFDKIDMAINDSATALMYSIEQGSVTLYELQATKRDTISTGNIKEIDFDANVFSSVSADSMYSYKATGISYLAETKIFSAIHFSILPNYTNYNFTSRFRFETDRIEASFANIRAMDFSVSDYLDSKSLLSSFIEIETMDLLVFRDKRKEFRHVTKPAFQDMIYNYPGYIRIDSIRLKNGNVNYTEHTEDANKPGSISFNEIEATICKTTNDTIYKTVTDFFELKSEGMVMGEGRISLLLKAKIFDPNNTFTLIGSLSEMEAGALNPMLEKNAFVFASSGKIDKMDFSFTANNTRATGNMRMLYHGLDLAVKNKRTDDTTAVIEQFISLIVNRKVMDANPLPGDEVRDGIITYKRDPERFLFNYCFKAILSGVKSSLVKDQKNEK